MQLPPDSLDTNVDPRNRSQTQGQKHGMATSAAVDRLRAMIVEGILPTASRISERMIQEQFGISRTPLREAFKVLSAEGIVSVVPNRGAFVAQLSLDELQSAFELLATLDGATGELACQRATQVELHQINNLHCQMLKYYHSKDLRNYFQTNKNIHLSIVDGAKNASFSRIYRSESARVDRYRFGGNQEPNIWAQSIREHEQINEALQRRQGGLLRELMIAHRQSGWLLAQSMFELETAMTNTPVIRKGP